MTATAPSSFRRKHVRLVRQTEITECGLAALAMISDYYGREVDLSSLRRSFGLSLRGASIRSLIEVADRLGFSSRAVKAPLERLGDLHVPAILHWDLRHFVVLESVRGAKAYIHDPEGRSRWLSMQEISTHFTGVALELKPEIEFTAAERAPRLRLKQLWQRVTGLKRALVQTFAMSVVMEAFVLASPYYMQIALDEVVPSLDVDLLTLLAIGFGMGAIVNAVASFLRAQVLLSAGNAFGQGVAVNVARRLFRLKMEWFEKRQTGDILSRFQSISPILSLLTEGAVASIVDGSLAIITLAVMFAYSATLTLLVLAALLIYALVKGLSFSLQRSTQEDLIIAGAKEQTTMIESLRGIVTLRLFNSEPSRLAIWQSRYVDRTNLAIALGRINNYQQTASSLTFGLEHIVSIWIAIKFVIDGGFTLGMVYAFMAYKGQFVQRAVSLIDNGVAFKMLGLHLDRLSDIALSEQDMSCTEVVPVRPPFSGGLELKGVSFRYGMNDPLVLDGLDLIVRPGEHVAITGPSGEGKSTLVRVLLGLLEPTAGEILVDGLSMKQFGYRNFHQQAAAVLQNDHLFTGSIGENIALFDESPDRDRIIEVAKAAAIHDDVIKMPMVYESLVGDMGSALSGGQKQRVLLARALYRRPRLLLMDEGTSHLDLKLEQDVNSAISDMRITRIIVAHRLETISNADRILALDKGRLSDVTEKFHKEFSSDEPRAI